MAIRKFFAAILLSLWVLLGLNATAWSQERFADSTGPVQQLLT